MVPGDYPPLQDVKSEKGDDLPIAGNFMTGDVLMIRSATSDMVTDTTNPKLPSVKVTLGLENTRNQVKANVDLTFYTYALHPAVLLDYAFIEDGWFSSDVKDGIVPRIGMDKSDVECRLGLPEHTNSDALGGDQMVYHDGRLIVYTRAKDDRVYNVQTSY